MHKYSTSSRIPLHTLSSNYILHKKTTMENPTDFQFPPNQTQHNPGPINARRNASTLPKTEDTKGTIIGAQAQLLWRKPRKIVKAKALAFDLNVPPYKCVLCGKTYGKERAICGHMKKHRNRPWKGLKPDPTWESFDMNKVPNYG